MSAYHITHTHTAEILVVGYAEYTILTAIIGVRILRSTN